MTKTRINYNDIKCLIFDMDGTLLDSLGLWSDIDERFFREHGKDVPSEYADRISHMSFQEMAVFTKEEYGFDESVEAIMKVWRDWSIEAYEKTILNKPFTKEYLWQMKKKGYRIALATTSPEKLYKPCLSRLGMFDCFDLCMDTNTLNTSKREPKIYLELASRLDCSPKESIVFEDIRTGIEVAKNAGFHTVAVYDKRAEHEKEYLIKTAEYYIHSFGELLD